MPEISLTQAPAHLRHGSNIIAQLIQNAGLMVVGAEYSFETGVVDFFDGLSEAER